MNRKILFVAIGAFALLGMAFSALATAVAPTSHTASVDLSADTVTSETSEPVETGIEDGGLDSNHEFDGEEDGEF